MKYFLTKWDVSHFSRKLEADKILSSSGKRDVSCCIICSKRTSCQQDKKDSCEEYALDKNKNSKKAIVETLCDTF